MPWPTIQFAQSLVPEWVLRLIESLFVFVAAYLLSQFVVRLLGRRIARQFRRPSITRTVIRGIRLAIFLFAFLTVLNIYGLGLGNIAIQVGVFTAVVGVILAPIVGSFVSGIFLLADQPYEIGDMIRFTDTDRTGFVEDITLRYTKVFTLDNTFLVIPNGTMRERDVLNYSAEDSRTRLTVTVVVTYESDIEQARELMESAARSVDMVIEGGPDIRVGAARYQASPTCFIDKFADNGIRLTLRYWIEEPYKLRRNRSAVQTRVWEALVDADVEISYPHSHLFMDESSGQFDVRIADGTDGPSPMERSGDTIDSSTPEDRHEEP